MRQLNATLAASLAAGATRLCACWRLTRKDGAVFGATDHDRQISFDGVDYLPANGLSGASFESANGLAPGKATAEGALDADFITEADLAAGLWDGARVDVWRVDWAAPDNRVRIWSGRLSEIARAGGAFSAELVSLKADLERPVGRFYARACDAQVGDARCRVDLGDPAFRSEGVVTDALGGRSFLASGLAVFSEGWFAGGALTWTSGANAGASVRIAQHVAGASARIELSAAPRFAISMGDGFVAAAGCDKSFATCGAKFANRDNFRGFPHLLGDDALLAGPASDRANDGGRRT
jgi:uncharacterized phage protein (TIGR02218 family)